MKPTLQIVFAIFRKFGGIVGSGTRGITPALLLVSANIQVFALTNNITSSVCQIEGDRTP